MTEAIVRAELGSYATEKSVASVLAPNGWDPCDVLRWLLRVAEDHSYTFRTAEERLSPLPYGPPRIE